MHAATRAAGPRHANKAGGFGGHRPYFFLEHVAQKRAAGLLSRHA